MCGAIPKIGLIVRVVELFKYLQSHILEVKIKPLVEFSPVTWFYRQVIDVFFVYFCRGN